MNKFTYIFDGPGVFLKDFSDRLMEMDTNGALTNKERFKLLFKKRDESFIINAYTEYVKGYSVLDDKVK